MHDSADNSAIGNGAYLYISNTTISGKTTSASSTTTTSTNYSSLSTDTWYRCVIQVNSDASQVTFTLYNSATGSQLWTATNSTNIPTANIGGASANAWRTYMQGGTSFQILDLDYQGLSLSLTR